MVDPGHLCDTNTVLHNNKKTNNGVCSAIFLWDSLLSMTYHFCHNGVEDLVCEGVFVKASPCHELLTTFRHTTHHSTYWLQQFRHTMVTLYF